MQITDIPINNDLQETTAHGSYSFPIGIYENQLDRNVCGFVNLHWHNEIQFSFVIKGCVEFTVNQKTHKISKGNGIFINSGCLHMAKPVEMSDSTYICVDVDVKMFSCFPGSLIEQKYVMPLVQSRKLSDIPLNETLPWQKDILNRLKLIYNAYERKEYAYELFINIELANIWLLLVQENKDKLSQHNEPEKADQQRLKRLLNFIHQNFMNKITLEDIALSANVSRGECCRLFKRMAKISPFEYLINYRINQSINLLINTDLTVSQISDKVGFGSVSYYIERFKKQAGCPPKEYRKNINKKVLNAESSL